MPFITDCNTVSLLNIALRLCVNTSHTAYQTCKSVFFTLTTVLLACTLVATPTSAPATERANQPAPSGPSNEFHLARMVFNVNDENYWHPPGRPWWRIDWPEAELHLLNGVDRFTHIDTSTDSTHVSLTDEALFDYPFLFAQQVGRWSLSQQEIQRLGDYLQRGGFLLVDDFHGPQQWRTFTDVINQALPGHRIEPLLPDTALMHILYPMNQLTQIPGRRHLVGLDNRGEAIVRMPHSPQRWMGIFDKKGRLNVAINFNMDMGDAWEHANDPSYPNAMTSLAYRYGINYIVYSLTH